MTTKMSRRQSRQLAIVLLAVLLSGCCKIVPCLCPKPTPTPACTTPSVDVDRSLVVHDPAGLASPFALTKTLQAIIDTSGATATTTPQALLQTLLDSFNATSFTNPTSGKLVPVDPRPS